MTDVGLDWGLWLGLPISAAALAVGIASWLGPSAADIRKEIDDDPTYRHDLAQDLRTSAWGDSYRTRLDAGLGFLDRRFGPAGSSTALGACITIALVYAFAGFFLVWAAGGPGVVGGFALLEADTQQPGRATFGLLVVLLPAAFYWLGRRLGPRTDRAERRLVTRLQLVRRRRGKRPHRRRALHLYRVVLSAVILAVLLPLALFFPEAGGAILAPMFFGALPAMGAAVGSMAWSRKAAGWTNCLRSTMAGAAIVGITGAGAVAVTVTVAGAGAVAVAVTVAGAVIVAGAVTVAGAFAFAVTAAGAVAGAGAFAVTVAGAGAVAGAFAVTVAVTVAMTSNSGSLPGAIGGIAGFAALNALNDTGGFLHAIAITILIFFLVLRPLHNRPY